MNILQLAEKLNSPRRGIEPRSSAWQAEILSTILTRNCAPLFVARKTIRRGCSTYESLRKRLSAVVSDDQINNESVGYFFESLRKRFSAVVSDDQIKNESVRYFFKSLRKRLLAVVSNDQINNESVGYFIDHNILMP